MKKVKEKFKRFLEDKDKIISNLPYINLHTNNLNHLKQALKMLDVLPQNYVKWVKENKILKNLPKKEEKKVSGKIFGDKRYQAEEFYKTSPFFYDKAGLWWLWSAKNYCWKMSNEIDILNRINKDLDINTISSKEKAEILNSLKQVGRLKTPKDSKPSWIQFKNYVYDLDSKERFEATPKFFIVNPISWTLGNSEETPNLDKLFKEWIDEDIQILYELLAFCCVPDYFIQRIFTLVGSGSNGKSTFLKILTKFLGKENLCSSSLTLIIKNRFESSKLYKKLCCLVGETNFNLLSDTELLKRLCGNDLIRAEFKNKDTFDFENTAKLIMATNSLPITSDKTDGFYRRWRIIEFNKKFKKEKDVLSEIPDEEYENLALKCFNLLERLYKKREFVNEKDFEGRRQDYESKSNPIEPFIIENYKKDVNEQVLFRDFFDDYNNFLEERGYRLQTPKSTSKLLKNEGYEIKGLPITKKGGGKSTAKHILGLSTLKNTHNTNNTLL